MQIRLAFGKSGLSVELPESLRTVVVEGRAAAALPDAGAAIEEALDRPVAGPPLSALAAGKRTAAISVCDITRPAPNAITLPPLLQRLHDAGIPGEGITIFIATGLHRAATDEELKTILGPEIPRRYRVLNHDARNLTQHRRLGTTQRGTPVWIDERFMSADLHITLGFIEPHLMLGFSGGRKLIAPGLAAQETIKVIHSPRFMREPMATEGQTVGNPLHAELLEIAAMARHDFILDVTLAPSRRISGVFAGEPVEAHAAGVRFLQETALNLLPEAADLVITTGAGYPLDLTFYQIVKGITAAEHIAKPGGRILLVGECSEGVGAAEFAHRLATYEGHQQYLDEIRNGPVEVDQWQLEKLALAGLKRELFFCAPGISGGQIGCLADRHYADPKVAIAAAIANLPPAALVAVVPEGPYTYARVGL